MIQSDVFGNFPYRNVEIDFGKYQAYSVYYWIPS